MKKAGKGKRIALAILCAILILAAAACFVAVAVLGRLLPPQYAAERWQGENETAFGQVSCFLPVDEKLDLNQIYQFRYKVLDKLREAGFIADTDTLLFRDAWCVEGKVHISSELGHGEASVLAVGGNFFDFHPLRLLGGNYISESDLMKDQVLLDEETAWLLFGGTDLQGMEMKIEGVPFVVAGVVEREQDFASRKAYNSGMGLYMSYDAYVTLNEDPYGGSDSGVGASCYELVMAEPVEGYTINFVKESFPVQTGEIVENSNRYSVSRLLSLVRQFGTRSMQTRGVLYPYWENAARCVEDWCALLLFAGIVFTAFPLLVAAALLVRVLKRGKDKLSDDLLPDLKEKAEEVVRKQQRRRWEKKHPGED